MRNVCFIFGVNDPKLAYTVIYNFWRYQVNIANKVSQLLKSIYVNIKTLIQKYTSQIFLRHVDKQSGMHKQDIQNVFA